MQENARLAVNLTYLDAVRAAGALPVVLPYVATSEEAIEYLRGLDGFLFTGGADIDPAEYGESRDEKCGEICPARDAAEKSYFAADCRRSTFSPEARSGRISLRSTARARRTATPNTK